jgi:hypothetical protein
MSFVFVSHSSQDKPLIRHIVDALIADGLKVWLDDPTTMGYHSADRGLHFIRLHADRTWHDEIDEAIRKAGVVLVCFSKRFNEKRDVWQDEAAGGRILGKLVGCRIDDVDPQMLRNQFSSQQITDVRPERQEAELRTAIALLVEDVRRGLHRAARSAFVRARPGPINYNRPGLPRHYQPLDLVDLRTTVQAAQASVGIVGVHGMGGIGKTVLATALTRDPSISESFDYGLAWLTFGRDAPALLRAAELALAITGQPFHFESTSTARGQLGELTQDLSLMVVLDDVWEPEAVDPFAGLGPKCCVLITTRYARVLSRANAIRHDIALLAPAAARSLLYTVTGWPDGFE